MPAIDEGCIDRCTTLQKLKDVTRRRSADALVKDYLPLVHEPVERIRIELPPDLVQRVEEFLRPFPVVSKLDTLGNRGFGVVRKFRKELFSYSV